MSWCDLHQPQIPDFRLNMQSDYSFMDGDGRRSELGFGNVLKPTINEIAQNYFLIHHYQPVRYRSLFLPEPVLDLILGFGLFVPPLSRREKDLGYPQTVFSLKYRTFTLRSSLAHLTPLT
jgi:hypothetical protein